MKDRGRQAFDAEELAVVLSRYDLGVIESVTELGRGSRRSPKVGIVSERGKFLLKRRASSRRSHRRVSLSHALQTHLQADRYPIAALIPTRDGRTAVVLRGDEVYELFEFVSGHAYGRTVAQTREAGKLLGWFHHTTRDFEIPEDSPSECYHDVNSVRTMLNGWGKQQSNTADVSVIARVLFDAYDRAAEAANACGFESLPAQIVHGDWHPGNLVFKGDAVVAVVDYDSCRVGRTVTDLANGALQCSMTTGDRDAAEPGPPADWPDEVDEERVRAFTSGYRERAAISTSAAACVPHLMIESLIAESAHPVARPGASGDVRSVGFLGMIVRKVGWLERRASDLVTWVAGTD